MDSDLKIKLFLTRVLGEDVFSWLNPNEISELENALLRYQEYPRDALRSLRTALEDILKRLYVDLLGFDVQDLKKKNGVSELGNYLYGGDKKLIHVKQYDIVKALGTIGNMGSHGIEIEDWEKWDISSTAAIGKLYLTLASIKSLFHYVNYGKLVF